MNQLEFFASCVAGLEPLLADELRSFGIKRVRPLSGGVSFFCDEAHAYRVCLWSRLASRIALVLGRVNAGDADLLYAGVYAITWENTIVPTVSMAVRAHGTNAQLRNTRFTTLRVKDAIVDRLRDKTGQRPNIDSATPDAVIDVRVHDKRATISLDFSGESLSHRGYLVDSDSQSVALSTTLAAGILAAAGWGELARQGAAFIDPVCGDGVLLTEAASIACDMAPGLLRERWGFYGYAAFDADAWSDLVAEADDRFEAGLAHVLGVDPQVLTATDRNDFSHVRFVGASASSPMISRARNHVRSSGLRQVSSVELGDAESNAALVSRALAAAAKTLSQSQAVSAANEGVAEGATKTTESTLSTAAVCLIASNLDARAGRAADERAAEAAYMAAAAAAPEGSRFVVASGADASESEVGARFGVEPASEYSFANDRIDLHVTVFDQLPKPPITIEIPDSHGGAAHRVEVLDENSAQFASRLRKVLKERRKWATREGVTCYRVYDADLPDYSVAIDLYEGALDARGNTYLHIAEYAAPSSIDEARARRRFDDVLSIAPVVCDVRPDHVFSKTRRHESGGSQYRNAGNYSYVTQVEENGFVFEVDLAGKLDTGIFLDTRAVRQMIGQTVKQHAAQEGNVRFLNLFAYTGTASVYAAAAGAKETTTVDLSQVYLDWAARNMANNGFKGARHSFERGDVMRWITESRRSGRRFDVVYVDPPTFSNSKAMGKRTWDVQRDHVELLVGVAHLLSEGGEAIFCCNLRSFKPNMADLEKYGVAIEDISAQTIPFDFARTPKIHKCYRVRRA